MLDGDMDSPDENDPGPFDPRPSLKKPIVKENEDDVVNEGAIRQWHPETHRHTEPIAFNVSPINADTAVASDGWHREMHRRHVCLAFPNHDGAC